MVTGQWKPYGGAVSIPASFRQGGHPGIFVVADRAITSGHYVRLIARDGRSSEAMLASNLFVDFRGIYRDTHSLGPPYVEGWHWPDIKRIEV